MGKQQENTVNNYSTQNSQKIKKRYSKQNEIKTKKKVKTSQPPRNVLKNVELYFSHLSVLHLIFYYYYLIDDSVFLHQRPTFQQIYLSKKTFSIYAMNPKGILTSIVLIVRPDLIKKN